MGSLVQFQKNLQKLDDRKYLNDILFNAIRKTEKIAISLQKQQLSEGRDNQDKVVGTYSRATELESLFGDVKPRQSKREGDPYNFEWTGDFFDGMELLFSSDEVSFWSKDSKTPLLVEKWENIMGLDDINLYNYIQNALYPLIMLQIRKTLQID